MGEWTIPDDSAITPNRAATLTLDLPTTALQDPGINLLRTGVEVAKRGAEGTSADAERVNCRYWSTGCWSPAPIQQDLANLHESTVGSALILGASAFNFVVTGAPGGGTVAMLQEVLNQAQSTITGASYSGSVPTSGDVFLVRRIPSIGSWDPGAESANAGFDSARPAVPLPSLDVPMDRIAVSNATFPNNQGFFLRWKTPETGLSPLRYLFGFGFGQYYVTLKGSGSAELWEYCLPATGSIRWVRRASWRFTQEALAPGAAHGLMIFPHQSPTGDRFIAFSNLVPATSPVTNTSGRADVSNIAASEHVYKYDLTVVGTDQDMSPGHVTSSDYIRLDMRRDLKLKIQISKLGWQTSATLIDDCTVNGLGPFAVNTNAVSITSSAVTPSTSSITATVINPDTGAAFTPGTDIFPAAKFVFASDGTVAPTLWGYTMKQQPFTTTSTPGSFSLPGITYSIEGYAGDPQSESASVTAVDLTGAHTRLQERADFSALLSTTYTPPASDPVTVNLFSGWCLDPDSERQGVPGHDYGADDWRQYYLNLTGQWYRLSERTKLNIFRVYAFDPASPNVPWKCTDVLRDMLHLCGFVDAQINIPDLPYRLWPGMSQKADDLQVDYSTNIAEAAVRMLRERLGCFLHFEPNSGTSGGQWQLIFGTQPADDGTFTPVWNFVSTPPDYPKAPYHPASYAASTSFMASRPRYKQRRPDANIIELTCPFSTTTTNTRGKIPRYAANPLSFAVPGSTVSPDPNHPDFLGRMKMIQLASTQCVVPGDYDATIDNMVWLLRRMYNYLCHGQKLCRFQAPLPILYDSSLAGSSSAGYRMLRFQDPISIDGDATWLVKGIRPAWSSDRVMMAEIEAIQPFAGQMFYGWDGTEHRRRAIRHMTQRNTGFGTHSALFGAFSPATHREGPHHELPAIRHGFGSIQNADGSFQTITGWNTFDGSDG